MVPVPTRLHSACSIRVLGFLREMFINGGETVTDGKLTEKDEICTMKLEQNVYSGLKKENCSIIFEKLLKNRITPHFEENMTQVQTGVKSKGAVDNLFI